ncbi:unnamed protein product [Staurois parvus]|uniref:Uncharacterized protein n=1 Tax=Staurois parvus TaxID=386267 RepID=A0ABN9H0R4_9NEOB|nr:unnamed protein product [Staurois parvus]
MGDTERQLKWALICGIDVELMGTEMWHWQVALMCTELALMDTDRWRCWGYTDHQCSDDHCNWTQLIT